MTLADECFFCLPAIFGFTGSHTLRSMGKYERLETVSDKNPYKISGKNL